MANQPPVAELKLGKCKALIWANDTQNGVRHNVTFARFYKDSDQWKETTSFGRDDMPLIAKLADRAHTWIYEQAANASADSKAA